MKITTCRICNNPLTKIISFGSMPMVNYYLTSKELSIPEKKYALTFCICQNCTLGQLDELVPPSDIFVQYHYASSVSHPLKLHLENLADLSVKRFRLQSGQEVLDIGCNDGVFLSHMKSLGFQTLGIDPAKNIIEKLSENGITAIADFFSFRLARKIAKTRRFDLIVSTNTLAQVIEISDFIQGIKHILNTNGVFIGEVGYMLAMIKKKTFDSIYHEHYSYFTLQSLQILFSQNGLTLFDAQTIKNHGGSLRIFARHSELKKPISKRLKKLMENERRYALNTPTSYEEFVNYFTDFKKKFRNKLLAMKDDKKIIAGVTAPAKGVILLNYCDIDASILDFIVDSTPYKQNRYMPGVHIPIFPEDQLEKRPVNYLLILAWNYQEVLLKKLDKYRRNGVKIIIPFPRIRVIT